MDISAASIKRLREETGAGVLDCRKALEACAGDAEKAKAFADRWGYKRVETDWRKLVAADDIDAIDICTPNNLHAEIAIEAAKHGKAILCEKPLSMNTAEGETMCAAVEKAGVPNPWSGTITAAWPP